MNVHPGTDCLLSVVVVVVAVTRDTLNMWYMCTYYMNVFLKIDF